MLFYFLDVLLGGWDVEILYGIIKVFEWGFEDGEKVFLLYGISMFCLVLGNFG